MNERAHDAQDVPEMDRVERLAVILHESGREAVEKRMIYRSDLPVKPFAEWPDLDENTKEGRRMMARFVISKTQAVLQCLEPERV